ncbi:hypothetical protein ES705_08131 [subsurface metagenome]
MVKIQINLNYLKEIKPIKDYLMDSPKSEKSIKTYLLALDKFFPYLVNRFKENMVELKDFDLNAYYKLNTSERNKTKKNWLKNDIHNKIFEKWKKLSPEKKSNILMKWAKETSETNGKIHENTYLNYAWRIQGLLSKLGRDYEANPKTLEQLKRNGAKIGSDIEYEDVIELYDKLNNDKYKLILKIMMYSGLNPIDILDLKPKNFFKLDYKAVKVELDKDFYYVKKERIKTKRKNVEFLLVFGENFFNEIKSYFERKIIVQMDKSKKEKIETLKDNKHFTIENETNNYIKFIGQYNWKKDEKTKIFGDIKSNTVRDTFKYYIEKLNLNSDLKPMTIRRLCFTLLKRIFPLEDKMIYDLWTQHKIGLIDNFYITDTLEKIIKNYIEKIESLVLIDNLKQISLKVNGYKEKVDKIYNLENKNKELTQKISQMEKIIVKMSEKFEKVGKLLKYVEFKKELDEKDIKIDLNSLTESIKKAQK